ncbi:MAG: FlgD immunoglobulin-like domain containing protein [Candidatus Eisenbacteria bacterium]
MLLDNDLRLPARIAVHEYFHLVQLAIDPRGRSWFYESTATWAIHAALPEDLALAYYSIERFLQPHLPLTTLTDTHEYAAYLYWVMLEELTAHDFVPNVMRRSADVYWETARDEELARYGLTYEATLCSLAVWSNSTGLHDDGKHFANGAWYPGLKPTAVQAELPFSDHKGVRDCWPTGFHALRVEGPGTRSSLQLRFRQPEDQAPYRKMILLARDLDNGIAHIDGREEAGGWVWEVPRWNRLQDVTLLLVHLDGIDPEADYEYDAEEHGESFAREALTLVASPNPFSSETELRAYLLGDPSDVTARIFDVRGRLVRSWRELTVPPGEFALEWDGTDSRGVRLPSGSYFLDLRSGDAQLTRRVMILK